MSPKKAKDDVKKRPRKVDVNAMTKEQVDALMEQISAKVSKEFTDLYGRLKPMLNIYGLDITLSYVFHPENETAEEFLSGLGSKLAAESQTENL